MSPRHPRVSLVVVSTLALAGLSALPAHATEVVQPYVTVATVAGDPGVLLVTATSDSPVTSVEAAVLLPAYEGGAPVTTVTLSRGDDGRWRSERLVLPAYRDYAVEVAATDADGDTNAEPGTLALDYAPQGIVETHTTGPARLDLDHRVVTATGRLTAFDPRTGEVHPAPSETVTLSVGGVEGSVRTASDGTYTVSQRLLVAPVDGATPVSVTWSYSWLSVRVPAGGRIDAYDAPVTTVTGRILLDATSMTASYPAPVKIAGVVQQLVDGTWVAVSGAQVRPQVVYDSKPTAVSGADGRFTLTLPVFTDGPFVLELSGDVVSYLGERRDSVLITVRHATTLYWERSGLDALSEVTIGGHLETTAGRSDQPPRGTKIYLQQSSDGTHWSTVGYVTTGDYGQFDKTGFVEHPTGYFRLRFPGTSTLQPANSRARKMSRIDTRVVSHNASPEPVRAGRTLRVTGTMQRYTSGAWRPFPKGQIVQLFFRAKGATSYTYKTYGRTTATGSYSIPVTARRDGYWVVAWFSTTAAYVNAYSTEDYVDVR